MLEAINSSAMTKLMAILFIFLSLVASLVVIVAYLVAYRTDPPQYVENIVYIGLAASINMLGVHIGAVTSTAALPPLPPVTKMSGAVVDNAQKS